MSNSYTYPLDYTWSHKEMAIVIKLWNAVEQAYESSIKVDTFLQIYKQFKTVVPSKSQEKQLSKAFEKLTNYSLYKVYQQAINSTKETITLEANNGK